MAEFIRQTRVIRSQFGCINTGSTVRFYYWYLIAALSGFADRHRASIIFCVASILGAIANALFVRAADNITLAWLLRLLTGLCLAGVYPMGMKLIIRGYPNTPAQHCLGYWPCLRSVRNSLT